MRVCQSTAKNLRQGGLTPILLRFRDGKAIFILLGKKCEWKKETFLKFFHPKEKELN